MSPDLKELDSLKLPTRIQNLEGLSNAELRDRWKESWRTDAPKGARSGILMLGIAWKWQSEVHGGLSRELARRLAALETRSPIGQNKSDTKPKPELKTSSTSRPLPGSRLIRDWRDERYEVHVTEKGYLWRGQPYGSLSAIAKAITGVSQNGPKFFGLRERNRAG